jgi:hypothetical protein
MAKGHHHSPQLDDLPSLWHPTITYLIVRSHQQRKFDACDYFAAAGQGGIVSWFISPLLVTFGADQLIKINENLACGDGAVVAFHFDHYCQPA